MHNIEKPEYNFSEIFQNCAKNRKEPVRSNLLSMQSIIYAAVDNYDIRMDKKEGHLISALDETLLSPLRAKDLEKLYDDKMLKGPARDVYDKLLVSSKKDLCCFCSHEEPKELDHFLPKTKFAEFSLLPLNLVPVCHTCNTEKKAFAPSAKDSFLHPYYDTSIGDSIWLKASILFKNSTPVIIYQIEDNTLNDRYIFQFNKLDLAKRYGRQAAREISSKRNCWQDTHLNQGFDGVKNLLEDEAYYSNHMNPNSWKTALYKCLKSNMQFCDLTWNL